VIGDRRDHLPVAMLDVHADVTEPPLVVGPELEGVVDEVDDDLSDPGFVATHARQPLGDIGREVDLLAIGEQPQSLYGLDDHPTEVHVVQQDKRAATLDSSEVEELVDHLHEMARLDLDLRDAVAHLRRQAFTGRFRFAGQRLREEADRRQGRP
jgi:hypothetical protein